jgi:hypothetical protein
MNLSELDFDEVAQELMTRYARVYLHNTTLTTENEKVINMLATYRRAVQACADPETQEAIFNFVRTEDE